MLSFAQQYGYLGIFIASLLGAVTIIFPLPYTLIIYLMGGFLNPFFVAIAGSFGSAIGELSGYLAGYYGRTIVSEKQQKNMAYMMKIFDRYGSLAIFIFALTPLPDDLLFIPLGMMRYKFIKAFIPSLFGKALMCFILAYSGSLSIDFIQNVLGKSGWLEAFLATIFLVFIMVAMLKIDWEKVFKKYLSGEPKKG